MVSSYLECGWALVAGGLCSWSLTVNGSPLQYSMRDKLNGNSSIKWWLGVSRVNLVECC